MTTDTPLTRLQRALRREGIHSEYRGGVHHLHNEHAQATVLLPADLPLEPKAVKQLLAFASVRRANGDSAVCRACATPDFHPGSSAPVGTVVATPADFVIPGVPATDINCGVRVLTTGLAFSALAPLKSQLIDRLTPVLLGSKRDVPVQADAFKALFDDGPEAFIDKVAAQGLWASVDRDRLVSELSACVGLASFDSALRHAPTAYRNSAHETFRDPCLSTIGSGNHFLEVQVVDEVLDRHAAYRAGIRLHDVLVMIHTGSREFGFHVGGQWMDHARNAWPAGLAHPESGLFGLEGQMAQAYLQAMGTASRYAWLNRVALAELVRKELQELTGATNSRLIVDVPHNVILQEQGLNIHRKGSTPAHPGDFALIPGSMGDASYLALGLGNQDWLNSCSHGAGRSVRRQVQRTRVVDTSAKSWECVTLREERRIEEAPSAYKPIGPVIQAQQEAGMIAAVARLRPWFTFKA